MANAKTARTGQAQPAPEPAPPTVEFDPATGIRSTVLHFDDAGYPGWWAKVRVNPRIRDWEAFSSKDPAETWQGLTAVVLAWSFKDGGSEAMPLPSEGLTFDELYWMHRDLVVPLISQYIAAVVAIAAAPKG